MKDYKDYLPFYLGCGIRFSYYGSADLQVIQKSTFRDVDFIAHHVEVDKVTLVLRPLSSMNTHEAIECWKTAKRNTEDEEVNGWQVIDYYRRDNNFYEAAEFQYLLSKHFDLFGLIDAGLATPLQPTLKADQ